MGKRPRRQRHSMPPLREEKRERPPLPLPTAWSPHGLAGVTARRAAVPIQGIPYGPRNTCPVDTLLTLLLHSLSKTELRSITSFPPLHAATPSPPIPQGIANSMRGSRALKQALMLVRSGSFAEGKRVWYAHICCSPWLMGHCFGISEQLYEHIAPSTTADHPLHFVSSSSWVCSGGCPYRREGLGTRVERSAHLSSNTYDYGLCPQCGEGNLRARTVSDRYSQLLVVELGRPDDGVGSSAADHLPWQLHVASQMEIVTAACPATYKAIAVVYNNGAHWWADLLCSRHFRKRQGEASYRYDGLEHGGRLRYSAPGLTLTSDPRFISLVLYRLADG
ncbi:MAG: hypothetical protein SGPRY_008193 [Prymnesium sp.]